MIATIICKTYIGDLKHQKNYPIALFMGRLLNFEFWPFLRKFYFVKNQHFLLVTIGNNSGTLFLAKLFAT